MTAAPGIISVDRGKTKVAHPVEEARFGALRKGGWNGAVTGERGWLESKGGLSSRD